MKNYLFSISKIPLMLMFDFTNQTSEKPILNQTVQQKENRKKVMSTIHDFTMKTIDGKEVSLSEYKGKVLLIVNVASKCGYTPQYTDLQKLYEDYKGKPFEILGFPANNFGAQEPGSDTEIQSFCSLTYNVTFPMFSKISVKGSDKHPLYKFITEDSDFKGDVDWNFQKYLIDKDGKVIAKFSPQTVPTSKDITSKIDRAIKN